MAIRSYSDWENFTSKKRAFKIYSQDPTLYMDVSMWNDADRRRIHAWSVQPLPHMEVVSEFHVLDYISKTHICTPSYSHITHTRTPTYIHIASCCVVPGMCLSSRTECENYSKSHAGKWVIRTIIFSIVKRERVRKHETLKMPIVSNWHNAGMCECDWFSG